jgi:hypothetical protein
MPSYGRRSCQGFSHQSLLHPFHALEERPPLERFSMMFIDVRADIARRIERTPA